MSHPEQIGFFRLVHMYNSVLVDNGKGIEIGSYDVNGSIRDIYSNAERYVGVDLCEGPGVDLVCFGHEVDFPDGTFDFSLSGDCFEHDPHWADTFRTMAQVTRAGGIVAFTCASTGFVEHGTLRTGKEDSPGTQSVGLDYYKNLDEQNFLSTIDIAGLFDRWLFFYNPATFGIYFCGVRSGVRKGEIEGVLPPVDKVRKLTKIMPIPHRLARVPLRVGMHVLPEEQYQNFAVRYWGGLVDVQTKLFGGMFGRGGNS